MDHSACQLANELIGCIAASETLEDFRTQALAAINATFTDARVAWVHQQGERWSVAGTAGSLAKLPIDLAATASEQMEVVRGENWLAVPVTSRGLSAEVLLLTPAATIDAEEAVQVAQLLRSGVAIARNQVSQHQRVSHLETLLQLAGEWRNAEDLSDLLRHMAHAAARVLKAERASIFLWDRKRRQLVGHPAMGVEGEPLRIKDDQGVAGRVLQSGETVRWDESQDPQTIDARVGQKLGYVTRSLVAVPLQDHQGQTIGVFEVLNHQSGRFSEEHASFLEQLAEHASAALENTQHIQSLVQTTERLVKRASDELQLVGQSPQIVALRDTLARVAPTELAVLVLGENGTGKEVVARSLHLQSARKDQAFVAVNCAAIAESLLESELFGHQKGAFTDAISDRAGKFEIAAGGTLLLDEIGEMSLAGQAKLLRVLEDKVVVRVGGSESIHTDVRIIAATNQDLVKLVREKRFREDLYFRLNVVTLQLPPLRERGEDILVLANHFLDQFAHQIGRPKPELSDAASKRLLSHSWPGNVRELRNLTERISYLTKNQVIEETDLAFVLSPASSGDVSSVPSNMTLSDATHVFQRRYIERHIEAAQGNLARAAKQLGMHRSNLYRKMGQLGMERDD
ncbi:MAG: sigma-54-dependent Fis family transcriptional regulator [bacterium]|nr:sigma-54-dependent Fis family transcriptional regulator [bacterium]